MTAAPTPPPAAPSTGAIALTCLVLGLTSYGGPAIVAQLRDTVRRKGWLTEIELDEAQGFCQLLPGPIGPQLAMHIGWRLRGLAGAVAAFVTYTAPAIVLMTLLSAVYFRFGRLPAAEAALRGLRAAMVGIVVGAILSMGRGALRDWRGVAIAVGAAAAFLGHVNVVAVLVGAGLIGVALFPREAASAALEPPVARSRSLGRTVVFAGLAAAACVGAILAARGLGPWGPALGVGMMKIDLLAFGGGYTAVALMFDAAVTDHGWVTPTQFLDGLALGQVTPGPVIVTATFIGYRLGGVGGALFATACVFLPSATLSLLVAPQIARLRRSPAVGRLVRGLLAAFIGMLLFVLWQTAAAGITDPLTLVIAAGSIGAQRLKLSPIWIVLGAMAVALAAGR